MSPKQSIKIQEFKSAFERIHLQCLQSSLSPIAVKRFKWPLISGGKAPAIPRNIWKWATPSLVGGWKFQSGTKQWIFLVIEQIWIWWFIYELTWVLWICPSNTSTSLGLSSQMVVVVVLLLLLVVVVLVVVLGEGNSAKKQPKQKQIPPVGNSAM